MTRFHCFFERGRGFRVDLFLSFGGSFFAHADAIAAQSVGLGKVSSGTAGVSRSGGTGGASFFEAWICTRHSTGCLRVAIVLRTI